MYYKQNIYTHFEDILDQRWGYRIIALINLILMQAQLAMNTLYYFTTSLLIIGQTVTIATLCQREKGQTLGSQTRGIINSRMSAPPPLSSVSLKKSLTRDSCATNSNINMSVSLKCSLVIQSWKFRNRFPPCPPSPPAQNQRVKLPRHKYCLMHHPLPMQRDSHRSTVTSRKGTWSVD